MKSYLRMLAFLVLTMLLMVCAASYVVDPYGIYTNTTKQFPRKVAAADKGRTVKPYQSLDSAPYTVIVGNSRVEIGMPPQHAFYRDKPVFNMGLPGANVAMQYDYARYVIANNPGVQQVVIALDFLDFTSDSKNIKSSVDRSNWRWRLQGLASPTFAEQRKYVAERISMLFSLSAITDIVSTIVNQNRDLNALDSMGFNDGRVYHFHVLNESYGALYQQKAAELDARLSNKQLVFSEKSYDLPELERFIRLLKTQNIDVYLLINPYQKPYLDKLTQHGLDEELARWKSHMVLIAKQYDLPLFDYAIESEPVKVIVNSTSRKIDDSAYFWEPAHYKRSYGALILDSFINRQCDRLCMLTDGER